MVIHERRLLVIKHHDSEVDWYSLPGGGQDPGETIADAPRRECLEELALVLKSVRCDSSGNT
jgi:8-oxo-dGTP diphosphatase